MKKGVGRNMKAIIVDISYNASMNATKAFLKANINASRVYCFDHELYRYSSTEAFITDLNKHPDWFFEKPCAFFDCVTAALSKERRLKSRSVLICSPQEDDCSRLSDDERFSNYIFHYERNNDIDVEFYYPSSYSGRLKRQPTESLFYRFLMLFIPVHDYDEEYT